MNDNFSSISHERKKRILDAAYQEFARHGYKRASTNRIIEQAGIGKGPLFSYFGNKQGLFGYLIDYALEFVDEYMSTLDKPLNNTDYIDKFKIVSKLKLEAYLREPCIIEFMTWIYLHGDEVSEAEIYGIKKYMNTIKQKRSNFMRLLNKNYDASKFREDIPADKLVKYINWTIDGYIHELTERVRSYEVLPDIDLSPYWLEFDEVIDNLKRIFYK